MDLKECYQALGGDYDDVIGRLGARILQKFACKFPSDTSFSALTEALEAGNVEEAFRAAHTVKGVCLNLGFTKLGNSAAKVTEALRAGDLENARALYPEAAADYAQTVSALNQFSDQLSD